LASALDSTAFQVADLIEALALDLDRPLDELRVDGGASSNDGLMQRQADLLGCPVIRTSAPDAAALGAAFLGGLAVGLFADESELAALPRDWDRFEPKLAESRRDDLLAGWRLAVSDVAVTREAALS